MTMTSTISKANCSGSRKFNRNALDQPLYGSSNNALEAVLRKYGGHEYQEDDEVVVPAAQGQSVMETPFSHIRTDMNQEREQEGYCPDEQPSYSHYARDYRRTSSPGDPGTTNIMEDIEASARNVLRSDQLRDCMSNWPALPKNPMSQVAASAPPRLLELPSAQCGSLPVSRYPKDSCSNDGKIQPVGAINPASPLTGQTADDIAKSSENLDHKHTEPLADRPKPDNSEQRAAYAAYLAQVKERVENWRRSVPPFAPSKRLVSRSKLPADHRNDARQKEEPHLKQQSYPKPYSKIVISYSMISQIGEPSKPRGSLAYRPTRPYRTYEDNFSNSDDDDDSKGWASEADE